MGYECVGCNRSHPNGVARSNHQRHCQQYKAFRYRLDNGQMRSRKRQASDGSVAGERSDGTLAPVQKISRQASNSVALLNLTGIQDPQQLDNPPPLSPLSNPPSATTTRGRQLTLPRRFRDMVPSLSTPLPHLPSPLRSPSPPTSIPDSAPSYYSTEPNSFGLFRQYKRFPAKDPEDARTFEDCCESPNFSTSASGVGSSYTLGLAKREQGAMPLMNKTVQLLLKWFYSGSTNKSLRDLEKLVKDVLCSPDYNPADLENFSARGIMKQMDGAENDTSGIFSTKNGWKVGSVDLRVPIEGIDLGSENRAPVFTVHGVHHRRLVSIIRHAFSSHDAESFHYSPFKLFWKKEGGSPERVITELYNSDAFIEEDEGIQKKPREPGCSLEVAIAAIMTWSDSTHLANFGDASLWPIYVYFGNQSKYTRVKPTSFSAHHLAYIPSLPDSFQDWYHSTSGSISASPALLTYIKRELMHSIWALLLDEEFRHAYAHGIVVQCADSITRRLFPRFFTYSADYPEKAILATIRFLGDCPCPRCMIKKHQINGLGSETDARIRQELRSDSVHCQRLVDKARKMIFSGKSPGSTPVNKILQPLSMVPVPNAFSVLRGLSENASFDYHAMFVPDLLHEFELGTWKATFTHLIRILRSCPDGAIQDLNRRYRQVPTFGQGLTIRKFDEDASAMRKLAARDFEDLLQCAIPVFELLIPEPHNKIVLDLLFIHAKWHVLAKLRLHTETTLKLLEGATSQLGDQLRTFCSTTCSYFYTEDLPQQEAARGRQKEKVVGSMGKQGRILNLNTYKLHSLGDYVGSIVRFGTSDGYSTQVGELEHRRIKKFYVRTNKRSDFTAQITRHEHRGRFLRTMEMRDKKQNLENQQLSAHLSFTHSEPLGPTSPIAHYDMANSRSFPINVSAWLTEHISDPATKDFLSKLKTHLLDRLEGIPPGTRTLSHHALNSLQFAANRIYQHKYLRVNYTTYDLQRLQDSINPRTHPDILILADNTREPAWLSSGHPYLYARVVGIYHADVQWHRRLESQRKVETHQMNFLWIRWFLLKDSWNLGKQQLPQLEFASDGAFNFLDPSDVLRGCHLIPAFAYGQVTWLGPSVIYRNPNEFVDWRYHYANIFVDRDMFMRYQGGGIGHGEISPPIDQTSFASTIAEYQQAMEDGDGGSMDGHGRLGDGSDPSSSDDETEWLDYGYKDTQEEYGGEVEKIGEDDIEEDGEGECDIGRPEFDGYGAFN